MKQTLIRTNKDFRRWLNSARYTKLAFDTETTSLDYCELDIQGFSLCDGHKACYVNLVQNGERGAILGSLKHLLTCGKMELLIMHNASFDLAVLHKIGIPEITPDIYDTQIAKYLLDENSPNSLKYLAGTELGHKTVSYEEASKHGPNSPIFVQYATNDAKWTWELYKKYTPELTRQNLDLVFYKVEMPFQWVLRDFAINGILLDKEEILRQWDLAEKQLMELTKELCDLSNTPYVIQQTMMGTEEVKCNVNFNSTQQRVKVLQKLGYKLKDKTDSGEYSTSGDALDKLPPTPFVLALKKFIDIHTLRDKFLSKMPNRISPDGRIRAGYNGAFVKTGRLSVSKPPLQQLPDADRTDLDFDIRKCFIAPKGKKLIALDYCFSDDTEILTNQGFIKFPDLKPEHLVAQINNGEVEYVKPIRYIEKTYMGMLERIRGKRHFDLLMTPDHKCLLYDEHGNDVWVDAQNYKTKHGNHKQPHSTHHAGGEYVHIDLLRLVAAIQADARVTKSQYVFWFSKPRKIVRLKQILDSLGVPYTTGNCKSKAAGYRISIYRTNEIDGFLGTNKTFKRDKLISLNYECRQSFLNELHYWDGSFIGNNYLSTNLDNCNLVQELCCISGIRSNLTIRTKQKSDGIKRKPCGKVTMSERDSTYIKTFNQEQVPYCGKVYCVEVPTHKIIVRRNGHTAITGNCGQEIRILADQSKDPVLIDCIETGKDVHLTSGNRIFDLNIPEEYTVEGSEHYEETKKKFKNERHKAKNGVVFPLIYGKAEYGIAKDFNITEKEAKGWIGKFFGLCPNVAKSIKGCHKFLSRHKYVYTKTGRRRRFDKIDNRAKRQAYNFLIQGTAADMLKRAMVGLRQLLLLNPEWEAIMVLTVHDEIVVEVKEEFAEYAAECMKAVMINAYKLSVPLDVSYGIGDNYSQAK